MRNPLLENITAINTGSNITADEFAHMAARYGNMDNSDKDWVDRIASQFIGCLRCICRTPESEDLFSEHRASLHPLARTALVSADTLFKGHFEHPVRLFRDYNRVLVSRGYGVNFDNILDSCDQIDASKLYSQLFGDDRYATDEGSETIDDVLAYIERSKIYGSMPCYPMGIMSPGNNILYYWHVKYIDPDEKFYKMDVSVSFRGKAWDLDFDVPLVTYCATIGSETDADLEKGVWGSVQIMGGRTLEDWFTLIAPKRLWKSKDDRLAWNKIYIQFAREIDKLRPNRDSMFGVAMTMQQTFQIIFGYINMTLEKKRVSRARRPSAETIGIDAFDPAQQYSRKVRTLDSVIFISERIPRSMNTRTVRQYHVGSWKVRGHTRTTPKGNTAYVRAHTRHRRCIAGSEYMTPAPVTLKGV